MPAIYERVNLGICGTDDCDDCWVEMRICAGCERGPLDDDEDNCGECFQPRTVPGARRQD